MDLSYTSVICSDIKLVGLSVNRIMEKISKIIIDDEEIMDIRLILNELMINGVLHGNNMDQDKCVRVVINLRENNLTIEVEDEGEGILYKNDTLDADYHKCHGRGLAIINALADEVIVDKTKISVKKTINH